MLHDPFDFGGVVSGFNEDDHLDLLDVAFGDGTTTSYVANQAGTAASFNFIIAMLIRNNPVIPSRLQPVPCPEFDW
ncbi:hypothetical protein [Bradyrhizobium sp. WYCCWR 12699]|uniref:hypothetical protein n=1 Tax=Bradyrhizobium sp. WYCCWR 12699 TaxID=3064203 RepID=UPI0028A2E8B1|nr:hypothetical protein [Bradyrhizobium sp. WYCCWR 12699]MDT4740358.1 hypothetical protein [Bradyrhizobium sp. WYCCWR 12699]